MSTRYMPAPEVEKIGRDLIGKHHRHLLQCRVTFLFCDKTPKKAGREVWGTARRVSSLNAFLAGEDDADGPGAFFVIVISEPVWNLLRPEQRVALIDHELCHCWVEEKEDGNLSLQLVSHDLEEFAQIVLRHGLWREEVTQFYDVATQAAQRSLYEDEVTIEGKLSKILVANIEQQTQAA